MENTTNTNESNMVQEKMKFCKHCGGKIPDAAVICTLCGCQVEEVKKSEQPSIIINNANNNTNTNINGGMYGGRKKDKWVAFILCLLFGYFGAHKFYEGKILAGLIYLFTFGLFGFGWIIDCISLLLKPNPYYI